MPPANAVTGTALGVGDPAPATYLKTQNKVDQAPAALPDGERARTNGTANKTPFRTVLRGGEKPNPKRRGAAKRLDDSGDASPDPVLRNLGQWFRAEIPPASIPRVKRPLKIEAHQRVLMTSGATTPQARLEISGGKLAGSQILLSASGPRIEAQVLTGNEASRQTLVAAMNAVRERLRARGLLVASGVSRPSTPAQDRAGVPPEDRDGFRAPQERTGRSDEA